MKRIIVCAAVTAAVLLMAACKKDGVYRPSDKLTGVLEYYERVHQRYDSETKMWNTIHKDSTARHTTEKWLWNGKQLARIDFYTGNTVSSSVAMVYDGKRLVRANVSATNSYIEYEYNGRHLSTMTLRNKKGEAEAVYTFEYDGNKVVRIAETLNAKGAKAMPDDIMDVALLPLVGDRQTARDIAKASCKKAGAKASEQVYDIVWKGDNIKAVKDHESGNTLATYKHDAKTNPLRGLLLTFNGEGGDANQYAFGNKNNIVSVDYGNEKLEYSYTYSGDLPVSRSRSVVDHYTQGYRYVETTINYFDYEE